MSRAENTTERCSFCEKARPMVECLIAGPPGTYICNECIELCQGILDEELKHLPTRPRYNPAGVPRVGIEVCAHSLRVLAVHASSPAAHAGLKEGDILEHDVAEFRAAVADSQLDGRLRVNVRRKEGLEAVVIELPGEALGKSTEL